MKKSIRAIISVILSVILCVSAVIPSFAALSFADIISGAIGGNVSGGSDTSMSDLIGQLISGGSLGDVNIAEILAKMLDDEINKESPAKVLIEKIMDNIKNGVKNDGTDDPSVEIDKEALNYAVELFNLTVNRIKQEKPFVIKSTNSGMSQELGKDVSAQWMPILSAIASSVVSDKSLVPAVIGAMSDETATITRLGNGVSHDNDIPLTGTPYVSTITADQVKNFSMTIHKSGAYSIRLDLPTVYGSPVGTGYDALFDVTDNSTFKVNLIKGLSFETPVFIKYINSYAEVNVNKKGEISGYKLHMECTASLADAEGNNPIGLKPEITSAFDFEEQGLIYVVEQVYNGFNWGSRKMGDIDNNNKITTADARLLLRAVARLETLSDEDKLYADINQDGKITAVDARLVLRGAAKLITLPDTDDIIKKDTTQSEKTQTAINNLIIVILAAQAEKEANASENPTTPTTPTTPTVDPGKKDDSVNSSDNNKTNYSDYINSGANFINDLINGLFSKKS